MASKLPAQVTGALVEFGLEAGLAIGRRIITAIANGGAEWEALKDILPEEYRTKAILMAETEKARRELEGVMGADPDGD